ncbi:MAG: hypothetical protein ACHQET_00320 [Chitinophagales bacterium]
MKSITKAFDFRLVVLIFLISRIILLLIGFRVSMFPLYAYWQYLDIETLKHNLLVGVWYDHAQPPIFNLFLGLILKIFGSFSPVVFEIILKGISIAIGFLLFQITKSLTNNPLLTTCVAIAYLLSPATMIYECELFYTTCISLLLLLSIYFLQKFQDSPSWRNSVGVFFPLALLCLTRSMYHLLWMALISMIIIIREREKLSRKKLLTSSALSLFLVFIWYAKNWLIFGIFSSSSWLGMNLSRNVFHDQQIKDSSNIVTIGSFEPISKYGHFYNPLAEKKYAGLNDRDLLLEYKNDTFMNANHVGYIDISRKFMESCKKEILAHPAQYLLNVLQSSIIFFTPATRYTFAEERARTIKYYDVPYSFNLSQFAGDDKQKRRIALTISAIPKMLFYLAVLLLWFRYSIPKRKWTTLNLVIIFNIGFVFAVSSLFEHFENMRFRFEVEPLFMILAVQTVSIIIGKIRALREVGPP